MYIVAEYNISTTEVFHNVNNFLSFSSLYMSSSLHKIMYFTPFLKYDV